MSSEEYLRIVYAIHNCAGTDENDDSECNCDLCPEKDKIIEHYGWTDYTYCVSALMRDASDAIHELMNPPKPVSHNKARLYMDDDGGVIIEFLPKGD